MRIEFDLLGDSLFLNKYFAANAAEQMTVFGLLPIGYANFDQRLINS